jgi:hypothetical protein
VTQFEFISVAVSIVLGLSAARLLTALPHLLAPDRRYWVHALWWLVLLSMHLGFWWAIWVYREIDPWSFRGFVAIMLTPGLLFLAVNALVSDSPGSVQSWRTHYYARHRAFLSLLIATVLSIPLRQFALLGDPIAPAVGGVPAIPLPLSLGLLAITVMGVVVTSERFHTALALVLGSFFLFNFARL